MKPSFAVYTFLLLNSGCTFWKTIPPSLIQPVRSAEKLPNQQIDYSTLSWQEAIKIIQTPEQAQDYLDRYLTTDQNKKGKFFAEIHHSGKGNCFAYSIAAAALLSDDGYKPNVLHMEASNITAAHAAFLYKTPQGYNALGNLSCCRTVYRTIDDLVKAFANHTGITFDKYFIADLDLTFPNREWITGRDNLSELFISDSEWIKIR